MRVPSAGGLGWLASQPASRKNTLRRSCAPAINGVEGVLALKLMRPAARSKWAATSVRRRSAKRSGSRPSAPMTPVLVWLRNVRNSIENASRAS